MFKIPTYSLLVILGCVLCFNIACIIVKKKQLPFREFALISMCGGIGAVVGAKFVGILTVLIESLQLETRYDILKDSGYSFYGGLWGLILFVFVLSKVQKIEIKQYSTDLMFLIPLCHSFWKIGCFCGGCCFGISYNGPFAVRFPEGVNDLAGTQVLPIQLVEAAVSIIMAVVILGMKHSFECISISYCLLYSVTRLILENLRYHKNGLIVPLGYVYSLISIFICVFVLINYKRNRKEKNE